MKRRITCPVRAHLEEIEISISPTTSRILGVSRCTAFCPPEAVSCDKLCIKLLNDKLDRTGRP